MIQPDEVIAGRYRLVRRIGSGGMGSVWEARDERLQRAVALKLLHPRPGMSEADAQVAKDRAMREGRITARLHHPHAVPVFDVVEHDGQPCLIMRYLPSRSLQDLLAEKRTLPPDEVALIGAEVASALAAAHAAGIVHRDVKPGNILITEDGTAMITDFGISHALGDAALTSTGMVTGTPAYLAPEIARGADSSSASDVFSLGATLYAAVEGTPPFGTHENPMALLHRVASEPVTPPSRAGALGPALLRMLAGRPEDRPSMAEVTRTLETLDLSAPAHVSETTAVLGGATQRLEARPSPEAGPTATLPVLPLPGPAVRPTAASPAEDEPRRSRAGLVLLALALLVGIAAVFAIQNLWGDGPSTAPPAATSSSKAATATTSEPPRTTTEPSRTATTPPPTKSTAPAPAPAPTTTTPSPEPQGPTAQQLARAITDYYSLLPDDTKTGYSLLTDRFRRDKAGSLQNYQAFWDGFAQVSATDATGRPPGTVEATITYRSNDGRVSVERTAYTLVEDGGVLKIDSSKVLSR
jgi:serine/threonine protein kinase